MKPYERSALIYNLVQTLRKLDAHPSPRLAEGYRITIDEFVTQSTEPTWEGALIEVKGKS